MSKPLDVGIDLKFNKIDQDYYDLSLSEEKDLATINNFDTALLMSIFCERRADKSEIPVPHFRRGWFGNEFNNVIGFEIGSKVWLLEQSRRTENTLNFSENYVRQGLEWLIEDNYLTTLKVNGEFIDNTLRLTIELFRNKSLIDSQIFILWENTGKTA